MRKEILKRLTVILILTLALSSVISSFVLVKNMLRENIDFMTQAIGVVDYSLNEGQSLEEQVNRIHAFGMREDTRITVIDKNGTVLADSDMDNVEAMENHLERKEIRQALETGSGSATRYSESLGKHLLYVAKISEDGTKVIRISVPYNNILEYMIVLLPLLTVGLAVALVIGAAMAARFSSHLAADEMKRQMEQMEKDRKIRQEFFSNASHELKTPITSIRGYAELLCQDFASDDATRKDFLNRILKETEHMTGLIDDILMISRLESKDAEVTLSKVQMKTVLREVLERAPGARLCCGHMHRNIATRWRGVPVTVSAPICMLMEIDFTEAGGDRFWLADPQYTIHHFYHNQINTYNCIIPTHASYDGPFPFKYLDVDKKK